MPSSFSNREFTFCCVICVWKVGSTVKVHWAQATMATPRVAIVLTMCFIWFI